MGTVGVTEKLIKVNQEYKNRDKQIQEWSEKQHTFFCGKIFNCAVT
jgi:hypothetical protein